MINKRKILSNEVYEVSKGQEWYYMRVKCVRVVWLIRTCTHTAEQHVTDNRHVSMYLLWFELHACDVGRVHHRFGSLQCFYQTLPLRRQSDKTAVNRIEGRVNPVLEVLRCRNLQPSLLLFPLKHSDKLWNTRDLPISAWLAQLLQQRHSKHHIRQQQTNKQDQVLPRWQRR